MDWLICIALALLLSTSWNALQGKRYAKEVHDRFQSSYEGEPSKVLECPYGYGACEAFPFGTKPCLDDQSMVSDPAKSQAGLETKVSKDPRNWLYLIYPPDTPVSVSPTTSTSKPTTTGGKKVYNFGTVQNGTRGAAAYLLQTALNLRANAGLVLDGISGVKTVAAIKAWQKAHGLTVDGICGKNTWNSLLAA